MEVHCIPSHNHPKRSLSIKSKTWVQLGLTSLSNSSTIKSETRYPNIKGVHVSNHHFGDPDFIVDQVDDLKGKIPAQNVTLSLDFIVRVLVVTNKHL